MKYSHLTHFLNFRNIFCRLSNKRLDIPPNYPSVKEYQYNQAHIPEMLITAVAKKKRTPIT